MGLQDGLMGKTLDGEVWGLECKAWYGGMNSWSQGSSGEMED